MRTTYEAGNYSHAVVDSIRFLSEVLRSQSGVDGDGSVLVGQALGGDVPKLKLNRLQSQSEKDEQKGYEHLLRGIYIGLRNPRVHDQTRKPDSREEADVLIGFIDLMCRKLLEGQAPFTIESFVDSIFDTNFVRTDGYAKLLIAEVPTNKRLEVAVALFRSSGSGDNVRIIAREIVPSLTEDDRRAFYAVVSTELRASNDTEPLYRTFQMISPDGWAELHEISRARTESRIARHVRAATMLDSEHLNPDGALVTWTYNHFKSFSRGTRFQIADAIELKLKSDDPLQLKFVTDWMLGVVVDVVDGDYAKKLIVRALVHAVKFSDEFLVNLQMHIDSFADWKDLLLIEFEHLRAKYPALLKAIEESDEVPF